jgi:hypothetical protein
MYTGITVSNLILGASILVQEDPMRRKLPLKRIARLAWFYSVPAAILFVSAFFPLRPLAQQGMIGVMLIWIGAGAMSGQFFWE